MQKQKAAAPDIEAALGGSDTEAADAVEAVMRGKKPERTERAPRRRGGAGRSRGATAQSAPSPEDDGVSVEQRVALLEQELVNARAEREALRGEVNKYAAWRTSLKKDVTDLLTGLVTKADLEAVVAEKLAEGDTLDAVRKEVKGVREQLFEKLGESIASIEATVSVVQDVAASALEETSRQNQRNTRLRDVVDDHERRLSGPRVDTRGWWQWDPGLAFALGHH